MTACDCNNCKEVAFQHGHRTRGGGLLQAVRDLGIYECRAKTCQCVGRYHIHNTVPLKTLLELTKEEE